MNTSNSPNRTGVVRIGLVVLVVLAVAGTAAFFLSRGHSVDAHETKHGEEAAAESQGHAIPVYAVHPQLKPNFQMTVERPCDVEAYYTAPIEARAAGVITYLKVAPGSRVKKGQTLIRIDVPDRAADEKEMHSIVYQRQAEVKLAEEKVTAAEKLVETAAAKIKRYEALEAEAVAETAFRHEQYNRMYKLRQGNSVDQNVVDEAFKNLKFAEAKINSSRAATLEARAEWEDAKANVRVAEADVLQKKTLVQVAEAHWEQAKAKLDYATVKAPFDGTVVRVLVNPGATVQDATRGDHPTPLLILERTDMVTVSMQLPDNYAPLVTPGTEAVMEFPFLPGLKIHGKVTRYSDSLASANNDRTMRVEVDLWNGNAQAYEKFKANSKNLEDLKDGMDGKAFLPLLPKFEGKDRLDRSTRLKSKYYGNMTLALRNFGKTYLIPSNALIRQGGRSKMYVVQEGKAELRPVEVVVDDGNLAMVDRLNNKDQVIGPLTGSEEIIVSNQEELSEGQAVKATLLENYKAIEKKKSH